MWNKKEHGIFISWAISNHMCSIYTEIIKSQKQPKNLKRIPSFSTFGENTTQGVTKCNNKRCKIWDMIVQGKSFILKNLETKFKIRGVFNKFPDFFVQTFKIVVDSWKFSILLRSIIWDDWQILLWFQV